jgi:hypothetical protein
LVSRSVSFTGIPAPEYKRGEGPDPGHQRPREGYWRQDRKNSQGLPAALCIHCAGADLVEDADVYLALVAGRGVAGIAQGSLNLPDNIAKIGHGIIWNSWPCACGLFFF